MVHGFYYDVRYAELKAGNLPMVQSKLNRGRVDVIIKLPI